MRGIPLVLTYASICIAAAATVATVSSSGIRNATAAPASDYRATSLLSADDAQLQANRLAERAQVDAGLTAGRAPVPLPPIARQPVRATATAAASQATVPEVVVLRRPQENAAKAIEADGYRAVRVLERGNDGRWRAVAMRGGVEVALSVDDTGTVSMQ